MYFITKNRKHFFFADGPTQHFQEMKKTLVNQFFFFNLPTDRLHKNGSPQIRHSKETDHGLIDHLTHHQLIGQSGVHVRVNWAKGYYFLSTMLLTNLALVSICLSEFKYFLRSVYTNLHRLPKLFSAQSIFSFLGLDVTRAGDGQRKKGRGREGGWVGIFFY